MQRGIRVSLIDRRYNKCFECIFSKELSLSENIKLYDEILDNIHHLNYVLLKESNRFIDLNIALKEFELLDGQILYLY